MKRKLTANILIFAIILMMIPIHTTLAEPEMTPLPTEEATEIAEPAPTAMLAPELETQDPSISYAVPGEAPPVDYSMLDNYNNNYNSQYGQEPEEEPQEDISLQNEGDIGVEDNNPSVNESGTENFESTTFDSPFNQLNNQNENITLNQGSLNISNTILSLPGKNGLDLTLNLGYSSGSAVLDTPLYYYPNSPSFKYYFRVAAQNCFFAPGWELSKSYIEMYNMEDLYKPGTRAMTLHLADGRTYQVGGLLDNIYSFYGCETEDFKLEKVSGDTLADLTYLLTYKNGRTETFNWRGSLIQESDRFGNAINYFYEEEKLYRVNYKTYASNPAIYDRTFATLYLIQDSLGREIRLEREMQRDALGNSVQAVYFKMDGKNLAAAHFTQYDSSYGLISVLSSIDTYSIDPSTNETKILTTAYHYEEKIGAKTKNDIFYPGGNATIALTQIDYPTGAQSNYSYENEKEITYDGFSFGQNESYKISSRRDVIDGVESGRKDYKYINNSSGYPSSYKLTNPAYNGEISGPWFRYYTQVTEPMQDGENYKYSLYTFNNKHLKVNEEVYSGNSQKVLPFEGVTDNSMVAIIQNGNVSERYKAYISNRRLVIEKNGDTENEVMDVLTFGNISNTSPESNMPVLLYAAKSYQNYLLLFCGLGNQTSEKSSVIKYNTTNRSYERFDMPDNKGLTTQIIQSGDTFYIMTTNAIHTFSLSSNTWGTINASSIPVSGSTITGIQFLAEYNGTIYLKIKIPSNYLFKLENGTWTNLGYFQNLNPNYGFANENGFFILDGNKVKKHQQYTTFSNFIVLPSGTSYEAPFINQNGEIYVINKVDTYNQELYRLDFANVKWVYVTTLLMKDKNVTPLSDGTNLLIFSGIPAVSGYGTCSSGYEKINPYQIDYSDRTTTTTVYDDYKMPASTSVTTYGPAGQKKTKTTLSTYDVYKNLLSQTDALGRQTTYTYDTGTPGSGHYHLPTQIVQNVGTDKEVTTTNTLSNDKKNITLSSVNYGDNKLLHTKNEYSTTSPGNVIRQTAYETSEETPLNVTEYEYSLDYNEAYVTKQTVKDAKVNSADFTETTQSIATQSTYDSFGRVATSTDALGRVTSNVYYSNGWIKKATMPDGNFKEYTYQINANGVNKVTTNISGQYSTEDIYDNMGRMKEQKVPDTENVLQTAGIYAYDVNGKLYKQTDLYTQLTYTFDYLGRCQGRSKNVGKRRLNNACFGRRKCMLNPGSVEIKYSQFFVSVSCILFAP